MQSGSYLHLAALRHWGRAEGLLWDQSLESLRNKSPGITLGTDPVYSLPFVVVSATQRPFPCNFPFSPFLGFSSLFWGTLPLLSSLYKVFPSFYSFLLLTLPPLFIIFPLSPWVFLTTFSITSLTSLAMSCSARTNTFPSSSTAFKSHLQPLPIPGPHPLHIRHQKIKSEHHPSPQPGRGGSPKTDFPLLFLSCHQQEGSNHFLCSFFSWPPERLPFPLCFCQSKHQLHSWWLS